MVQGLKLCASAAGSRVGSLVKEAPRSHSIHHVKQNATEPRPKISVTKIKCTLKFSPQFTSLILSVP